jgi:chromosome segregation and condensation protein ScpB
VSPLARTVEALLFLAPEPVPAAELADAAGCSEAEVSQALAELGDACAPGRRGVVLR